MPCVCKVETYSRVVGYYRPVQQWNKGKQAEYQDRVEFRVVGKVYAEEPARPLVSRKNDGVRPRGAGGVIAFAAPEEAG